MAIVISDTSPIRALHHIGLLNLLPQLFGDVVIPPAVHNELASPRAPFPAIDATQQIGAKVISPSQPNLVQALLLELHAGESEAIALASDLQALLLIDESKGRNLARTLGVRVTGVLGVLLLAKEKGQLSGVKPYLNRLSSELRFHISDRLRAEVLLKAGERD